MRIGRVTLAGLGLTGLALLVVGICGPQHPAKGQAAPPDTPAPEIRFTKTVLDKTFRSEGVCVADVNRDGRPDILAGDVWYEAPAWKIHEIQPPKTYDPLKEYSNCFNCWAYDINGDGWPDELVVGMPGEGAWWYENPKGQAVPWKKHATIAAVCNESPLFEDLLGTGKPVLVCGAGGRMGYYAIPADPAQPWPFTAISQAKAPGTDRFAHGLGVAEMPGVKGKKAVLIRQGWWSPPADGAAEWPFHAADLGADCAQMLVASLPDGQPGIVTTSAHNYGMWCHRIVNAANVLHQEIGRGFSQTHALAQANLRGDGTPCFVTGKRYMAHLGRDPGEYEPAVLVWLEPRKTTDGSLAWLVHEIDRDSGVGTQVVASDLLGGGKVDIVVSNKKGVMIFTQPRTKPD